jgi:quinol-cytochrome oxidoreductase complex cytochrome b subunit
LIIVAAGTLIYGLVAGALADRVAGNVHHVGEAFPIIPPWQVLPFYAVLRSIPNKLLGVVVTFVAMAMPIIWPWMGADVLRTGPMRRVWLLLCVTFAAVWIGLTYLGSRSADPGVILLSQVLTVLYLAFFIVVPPLLRQLVGEGR